MAGGIGSRFWPISTTERPKQFLDFFGTGKSLLQITYERFSGIIPKENIFVLTNESYASIVHEQLPHLKKSRILLEPQRRNTAPCIAWASYHIKAINPQANIIVTPCDHLITNEPEFKSAILEGLEFVKNEPMMLTLGIEPNRPETGYGYIQIDDPEHTGINKVKTFTEKPNIDLAKIFVDSGEFLWNSGIFLWNVNTIIDALNEYLPEISTRFDLGMLYFNTPMEQDFIDKYFPACPNISIDFGLMEKASNVCVLAANFGWADLGTWGSLYDISPKDEHQNVALKCKLLSYESGDNIISLSPNQLAVIQGLEDYIVVQENNVLMICKKSEEQRIRQFVTDAKVEFGDEFI